MKKYFITLALIFFALQSQAQVSSFDYVTFGELNQQSAQIWNSLVQQKGHSAAADSLKSEKTLPPAVRALAQQVRQFIISSHVHFEGLKLDMSAGKVNGILFENVTPLLRLLLQNSILLDLNIVVEETKPGFFSPDSHRKRLIDLYGRSFHSADPIAWVRQRLSKNQPNPYEKLMVRVRSTAVAGLLAQTQPESTCKEVVSLSWGIQIRKAVESMSVGPETTQLFNGGFLGAYNDLAICARAYIEEQIKKNRYDLIEDLEAFNGTPHSHKQLVNMARSLFGE